MSGCPDHRTRSRGLLLLTAPVFISLVACQPDAESAPPEVRPVRTVTVVKRARGQCRRSARTGPARGEARSAGRTQFDACSTGGRGGGSGPIRGIPERVRAPAISAGAERQFPRAVRAGGAGHGDSAGATRDGQDTIEIGRGPGGAYRIAGGYRWYRNHHLG